MSNLKKTMKISFIALALLASSPVLATCKTSENNAGQELKGPWPLICGRNTSNLGISFDTKLQPPFEVAWSRLETTTGGVAVQSQPTVVGDVLYAANSGGNVFAVNALTGNLIWNTQIADEPFVTSPSISADGFVYIAADTIYALNATTGAIVWSTPFSTPVVKTESAGNTIISGDKVLVGISSTVQTDDVGAFIVYNRFTGEKLWQFDTSTFPNPPYGPGGGVWSCPSVDTKRGLIFVGSGQAYNGAASPYTDALLVFDLQGNLAWKYQFRINDVWSSSLTNLLPGTYDLDVSGHPILFSAEVDGKCVDLVGISSKDGSYRIFARDQKNPDYVQPLSYLQLDPIASIQSISTRAIANDGVLYLASTALIGRTGARESLDYAIVDIAHQINYLTQRTSVKTIALDLKKLLKAGNTSGTIPQDAIIWETTTMPGLEMSNPLSYGNGILYQTSTTGWVRAIDAKTGAELWRHIPQPLADANAYIKLATFCSSGVTVTDKMLYIGLGFETGGLALPGGGIVAYKPIKK